MSDAELAAFESEPFYKQALALREWDDTAKDPNRETPAIQDFEHELKNCLVS